MSKHLLGNQRKDAYSYTTSLNNKLGAKKTDREAIMRHREKRFILDGVHEHVHSPNVIPSYNAIADPHAQSYFRQPAVEDMLKKAAGVDGQLIPPAVASFKLSTRRRIPQTPGKLELIKKESRFIIDSIKTDSLKTRRTPVIPKYDALNDVHTQSYFKKKSVRKLLQQTCDIKI